MKKNKNMRTYMASDNGNDPMISWAYMKQDQRCILAGIIQ